MGNESSVKPQPLIAEILPGFTVLAIVGIAYLAQHPAAWTFLTGSKDLLATVAGLGVGALIVSWVIGTLLDACRDLIEGLIDKWRPFNWDFLFNGPDEDVERLNDWYLAYYFLNGNYAIGIVAIFFLHFLVPFSLPLWGVVLLLLAFVALTANALTLRNEMSLLIGTGSPHEYVYTRLKPSKVDVGGVGVFAVKDIKKGTPLFEPDDEEMTWIGWNEISKLPKQLKELYCRYGVFKRRKCGVPLSFNKLTVAWYMNEPKPGDAPNVEADKDYRFHAIADIKEDEELTIDYSKYSEEPPTESD